MLTGQYAHNHGVRGNQLPSGGYSKLAPTLGNTLPVWLQRAGLLHGPHRQVPERLRRDLAGHGSAARLERVVRVDRQPRPVHRRHLHGLRLHAQRERPGRPLRHHARTRSIPPPTRPTSTPRRPPTSSGGGHRATSRSTSRSPPAIRTRRPLRVTAPGTTRARRLAMRGQLAGLTAPRNPDFNEADVSDKPSNIKNLPLLNAGRHQRGRRPLPRPRRSGAGRRRSRPERRQHAEAAGRAEEHGADVHLGQRVLPRRAPGAAGQGPPV